MTGSRQSKGMQLALDDIAKDNPKAKSLTVQQLIDFEFYTVEQILCQAGQKGFRCEAREKSTSVGVLSAVRWSEAIERNETYEPFSPT
jgi:hypothetical protein